MSPGPAGHVVLVGLPGAGKTTVGPLVAACLGRPFLDLDREIERRSGRTVAELWAAEGEEAFRALEAGLTRELATAPAAVLAPGGGWAAQPGLVALLRPPAVLVHLVVRPETALERLRAEPGTRPLLAGPDPLAALADLWRRRRASYEAADVAVATEGVAPQALADMVARAVVGG